MTSIKTKDVVGRLCSLPNLVEAARNNPAWFMEHSKYLMIGRGSRTNVPYIYRFMSKIAITDNGCWKWAGALVESGYGRFTGNHFAHRLSYSLFNGKFDSALFVCHHCDNPPCVNPAHLFLGTPKDNHNDCVAKGRAHAPPPGVQLPIAKRGEHHWQKLRPSDIPTIRARLGTGEGQKFIAADYGVTTDTIGKIHRGERWFYV